MKHCSDHVSDSQLRALLFEHEDSRDSTEIAIHVETCPTCQIRLTEMVNEDSIELEANQLLCGYAESVRKFSRDSIPVNPMEGESSSYVDKVLLEPPTHPEMLGRIGRYEIERRIGSGGMGVVFKAIDTELNRPVAVKVLVPHLARNGAARQRFSRESRAAAAVVHEHVVAIHNVDSNAELPYLVMQYVSGESLQSRVEREGPLSVERILRIGIQAASGLSAAHQQGIIHRDIKPANILLEDGVDRLLITDFGLARTVDDASLTHTGVIAGTPNYMSPEQANGEVVDHRSDLFSLGSVLYFVAAGHPPFRAERAMGVLHRICHERHRPLWQVNAAIPDELCMVIDRLLEKRPAKRLTNAAAVEESLTRILLQLQNRRPHLTTQLRSWGRRHQRVSWVAATCVFVVAGLLTWSKLSPGRDQSPTLSPPPNVPAAMEMGPRSDATDARIKSLADSDVPSSNPSPPLTSGASTGDEIDVADDRAEFDWHLDSVKASLIELENRALIPVFDSFSNFQRELKSLDESLKQIDPTVQQPLIK